MITQIQLLVVELFAHMDENDNTYGMPSEKDEVYDLEYILSPEAIEINKRRLETIENAVKAIENTIKCFDQESKYNKELLETLNSAMDMLYYNAMGLDATISDHSPKETFTEYIVDMEKDETIAVRITAPKGLFSTTIL